MLLLQIPGSNSKPNCAVKTDWPGKWPFFGSKVGCWNTFDFAPRRPVGELAGRLSKDRKHKEHIEGSNNITDGRFSYSKNKMEKEMPGLRTLFSMMRRLQMI